MLFLCIKGNILELKKEIGQLIDDIYDYSDDAYCWGSLAVNKKIDFAKLNSKKSKNFLIMHIQCP